MNREKEPFLLLPGIQFLKNYQFLFKILLLMAILLIPIVMLTYFLHGEMKKVTDFAESERKGVAYILPLSELLMDLTASTEVKISQGRVQEHIQALEKIDKETGAEFKTTETWQELKRILQEGVAGKQQAAVEKNLSLISQVGDKSSLVLDPDLDSYYLMDAAVFKYPEMLSKMNELVSLVKVNTKQESISMDEQIKMAMVAGVVRSNMAGVKIGLETAVKENSSLQPSHQAMEAGLTESDKTLKSLKLKSVGAPGSGKEQPSVDQLLGSVQERNGAAYRSVLRQLDDLLVKRIEAAKLHEQKLLGVTGVALVFALYLVSALYYSMKRTMFQLLKGVEYFAEGDLQQAIQVDSKDEFQRIAAALNRVREQLRPAVQYIQQSSQQVTVALKNLSFTVGQSANAATQIAGSIADVTAGLNQQLLVTRESYQVVTGISEGIQTLAANAENVAGHSVKTAQRATEGDAAVQQAVSQIRSLEQTVNRTAELVMELSQRSKAIEQILATITAISGQTNLLALNAAIEAARAGEQGRGFAVVAEEVRKLAEQSRQATKQVAELVGQIQQDTERAITAMGMGTQEAKQGAEVVTASGQGFVEIVALVHNVSEQIGVISQGVMQMAGDSQRIVNSVQRMDSLSHKAAEEASVISEAAQGQSASAQEMAAAAQVLENLSVELQQSVSHFKV